MQLRRHRMKTGTETEGGEEPGGRRVSSPGGTLSTRGRTARAEGGRPGICRGVKGKKPLREQKDRNRAFRQFRRNNWETHRAPCEKSRVDGGRSEERLDDSDKGKSESSLAAKNPLRSKYLDGVETREGGFMCSENRRGESHQVAHGARAVWSCLESSIRQRPREVTKSP